MAVQGYTRVYYAGTSLTVNIVSANSGTDVFVVSGDYSRWFMVGTVFAAAATTAGADDGSYTSLGATYNALTNQTTISVTAVPSTQGAAGHLALSNIFIEFKWARVIPKWSNPAVTDEDRWGVVHRFEPIDSAKQQRYCNELTLAVDPLDIDKRDTAGVTWWEQLYILGVKASTEFTIFQYETNTRDSSEYTISRGFKGRIKDMADLLANLQDDGQVGRADVVFDITSDGEFTTFANVASLNPRTRPGA